MEFLQTNWFSFVMLGTIILERVWSRGKRDEKFQQVIDKVDEIAVKVTSMDTELSRHTADSNIHITRTLTELWKERNDYMKKEMADARRDIRRVEDILNKM